VEELRVIASRGLSASFVGQILIEESVLGWEELELEVVRDAKNQMITVCFIENVDAMGVHTGDSYCVAPMLTIDPKLQARLQDYSYRIVEAIGVIGGTNIQFAHDPKTGRVVIIEINPRTSRSSALASKATGFPIALVSAKLAGGLTLDEIPYWRDGSLEKYTPSGDYVVVKFSRWAFEKFKGAEDKLGTQMRAVGEVMSIGKTYKESFQKAIRSLENGRHGLGFAKDFNQRSLSELMAMLNEPSSERQWIMYEALRKGASVEELFAKTYIKPWFIRQMKELVDLEEEILACKGKDLPDDLLVRAKKDGFADKYLGRLLGVPEAKIRGQRKKVGCVGAWDALPVSGVDNAAYYYSTYNRPDRVSSSSRRKVMVLGGGPNRIGQGIEFDYCCCHASFALREAGIETIMVNCNPETVSTDYDTSDRLYFEPLTAEDVLDILAKESECGELAGVVVQFGGQTPLKLAHTLEEAGVPILGTSVDSIDLAEDRDRFKRLLDRLGLKQPRNGIAYSVEQSRIVAAELGLPLVVRPSYVLGGRAMAIIHDTITFDDYLLGTLPGLVPSDVKARYPNDKTGQINMVLGKNPLLFDRYLSDAVEVDVDALSDSEDVFICGIMEHIEEAGIHSGDSACSLPPHSLPDDILSALADETRKLALALQVRGLMNVQYALKDGEIYVLEVNPRAARTVPFVAKVIGVPIAKIAARIMAGERLASFGLQPTRLNHVGVKEAVFPFARFQGVDTVLGPEMRSTGEVIGLDRSFALAFAKSQLGGGTKVPTTGTVFVSVRDADKPRVLETVKILLDLGFKICATGGTARYLQAMGVASQRINKVSEGRPHVVDAIKNGGIQLVLNTTEGAQALADSRSLRRAALLHKVPYYTTLSGAIAASLGIKAYLAGDLEVRALQDYFTHGEETFAGRSAAAPLRPAS
jgi:carbamoyl-phosphate synthase large subunit